MSNQPHLPGMPHEPQLVGRREPSVYGVPLPPPDPRRMVTEVIVLTKGINPGHALPSWTIQASSGVSYIEAIGALDTMSDGFKARVNKGDYR